MSNQETSLLAMRISRLTDTGVPATGAANAWAVADPVKVDVQFAYDNGTDIVQKDGAGRLCFVRKRPDNLKNATVKFEVCGGDPGLLEIVLSGDGHTVGGGTPTGFGLQAATCGSAVRAGAFIEWFTESYACNTTDIVTPNSRHFLPKVVANYDGGTWDEARHAFAFTGVCQSGVVQTAEDGGSGTSGMTVAGGPFNDILGFAQGAGYLYGFTHGQNEHQLLTQTVAAAQGNQPYTTPAQS